MVLSTDNLFIFQFWAYFYWNFDIGAQELKACTWIRLVKTQVHTSWTIYKEVLCLGIFYVNFNTFSFKKRWVISSVWGLTVSGKSLDNYIKVTDIC